MMGLLWEEMHSIGGTLLHTSSADQQSWRQPSHGCWPIILGDKVIVQGSMQVSHGQSVMLAKVRKL